jgi:hypothetical protein
LEPTGSEIKNLYLEKEAIDPNDTEGFDHEEIKCDG